MMDFYLPRIKSSYIHEHKSFSTNKGFVLFYFGLAEVIIWPADDEARWKNDAQDQIQS
jgi:hypothetical protein